MQKKTRRVLNNGSDVEVLKRVKKVLSMLETHSYKEIGDEVGMNPNQVCYLVQQLREHGYHLPRKQSRKIYWERIVAQLKQEEE